MAAKDGITTAATKADARHYLPILGEFLRAQDLRDGQQIYVSELIFFAQTVFQIDAR